MQKRLQKSRSNVVLTGTLAGIAEYFGIDPTIVRVIYVFLSFGLIGAPVILYILLALVIPAGAKSSDSYGHNNPYYGNNNYKNYENKTARQRKKADKIDDDDWSDF
ncbi:PspC domain-containing protein [Enterococcus pseudoavium]|uniref:PspC domain-containing protein n=1 Tax=Enterococcus pseudoavium TaxID=44007 RepID=A0AAE4I1N7_9ENTE|nr:PspC domain-containing protein [Enterococcus pseudoavium]MDT2736822.1 PspC domain-containing protein [Enterococcus pseudoavium]MDT2754754.1 PspC domain-containing protein [Enterococcus pseudoavium]MDT2770427.1 PspC domain-containing protein [Enterococcus pseudoavium]REC33153.1 PspC domain-containing protein [Enterococcus pseudoavium]